MTDCDTFPKLLKRNYEKWGEQKVAMRKKKLGIWREYTWQDYYQKVRYFSLGLIRLGFKRGDKLSILGDNDPEWFWAEAGAQAAKGAIAGIFADCLPDEVKYIVEHSDSKFVVCEDQEQVDKLLQIKDQIPLVKKVIYWDPKGLKNYEESWLMSFDEVLDMGKKNGEIYPGLFEQNIDQTKADDLAVILYTSGTSGLPKGAMMSYRAMIDSFTTFLNIASVSERDEYVSFTLPGWIVEQGFGYCLGLMTGQVQNFVEEPETVQADLREIAPHTLLYPSRLWENLNSTIRVKLSKASFLSRMFYRLFLSVGYKVVDLNSRRKKLNLVWRVLYNAGDLLVFRPLRDKHGLVRLKNAYSAGAVMAPDNLLFFRAIGVELRQCYGITEVGFVTLHTKEDFKLESVGKPLPGLSLKISNEGEILIPREKCFIGYYKDHQATEKVFEGGWFHTGDSGHIDEDGHLIFWDRLSDLRQLEDGTKYAPQYIETSLKFSPYIRDAIALGDESRAFVSAIVNIDFEIVRDWAERMGISYTTFADLSQKPRVCELIREEVKRVNRTLSHGTTVRRFINLAKELDPDEAELTRTKKLRRNFVEERYKELIEALYSGQPEVTIEAPVVYRDGRRGLSQVVVKVNFIDEGRTM